MIFSLLVYVPLPPVYTHTFTHTFTMSSSTTKEFSPPLRHPQNSTRTRRRKRRTRTSHSAATPSRVPCSRKAPTQETQHLFQVHLRTIPRPLRTVPRLGRLKRRQRKATSRSPPNPLGTSRELLLPSRCEALTKSGKSQSLVHPSWS